MMVKQCFGDKSSNYGNPEGIGVLYFTEKC